MKICAQKWRAVWRSTFLGVEVHLNLHTGSLNLRPGSAGPACFEFRGRLALAHSTDRRASLHEGEHGRCFAVTEYEFGKVGVDVKGVPERRTM